MKMWLKVLSCLLVVGMSFGLGAWPLIYPTGVTVHKPDKTFNGYTVFLAMGAKKVFCIDMEGNIKHSWSTDVRISELGELLPNGHVLVARAPLTEYDWDGIEVWKVEDPEVHHDFARLANGNTLVLSGERLVDPKISDREILDDIVYEITPEKEKVWVWRNREHFDELGLSDEAKGFIRQRGGDWAHINSMDPIPENPHQSDPRFKPGNIIMSYRLVNVTAIIDRETGKIVWRLGPDYSEHPAIRQIIGQHDARMIPKGIPGEGNVLIYDNGISGGYSPAQRYSSRIVEINPVTMELVWQYPRGQGMYQFFSQNISGAQRLPNGNTLITEGMNGRIFEVTTEGDIVWEYINPFGKGPDRPGNDSNVFRATRVPFDYVKGEFKLDPKDKEVNENLATIREHLAPIMKAMEAIHKIYPAGEGPGGGKAKGAGAGIGAKAKQKS